MKEQHSVIVGNLDVFVAENEDSIDGVVEKWYDILIHGDPNGLRSLAKVLLALADANQNELIALPVGEREHIHLRPKFDLSNNSDNLVIGRLDAKGTGKFYERFISR